MLSQMVVSQRSKNFTSHVVVRIPPSVPVLPTRRADKRPFDRSRRDDTGVSVYPRHPGPELRFSVSGGNGNKGPDTA